MPPRQVRQELPVSTSQEEARREERESEIYKPDKDAVDVPIFNGDNYPIWEKKMKVHL